MRSISEREAKALKPGSEHYTAYVGPPKEYDFMGATQFALLFALGIRETDNLLDFGCGSIRAGRFLISFLEPGRYYGIEPNRWLIEDAIDRQIGRKLIEIKKPHFSHSDTFEADVIDAQFDFIVAQSIFSHSGPALTAKALASFKRRLCPNGLCAVTFIHGEGDPPEGWMYPQIIHYRPSSIENLIEMAGLVGSPIPWYHPKQTWWLLAHHRDFLPSPEQRKLLLGTTLRPPEPRQHGIA